MDFEHILLVGLGNGRYLDAHVGGEAINETRHADHMYYGYVPPLGNVIIDRFGPSFENAEYIDDVLVVYCRQDENRQKYISSFCPSARVYRRPQSGEPIGLMITERDGTRRTAEYHVVSPELCVVRKGDFVLDHYHQNPYILRRQRSFLDEDRYQALRKAIVDFVRKTMSGVLDADDTSVQAEIDQVSEDDVAILGDGHDREIRTGNTGGGEGVLKDARYSKKAKVMAGFRCEIDATHKTFTSRETNKPYVEGHHLIPCTIENSTKYRNHANIDCVQNIVSLCPNCHKMVHLGANRERAVLIQRMFEVRKERLEAVGIVLSLEELLEMYGIQR